MSANERPVVLCVDDATDLLALIAKALGSEYQVLTADNAGDAISMAFGEPTPDLILLDVDMPDVSGFEVCQALKGEAQTAEIPVIFLTSRIEAQDQVEGLQLGAVDYIGKPINAAVLKVRVRLHLSIEAQKRELAEQRNVLATRGEELERIVQERTEQLDKTRAELIKRLARAMELHESAAVGNRVMRLGQYAKLISLASGAKPEIADMMMKAAPLHDIGKLGVPAEILRKAEKLSVPDWERVKRHPQLGAEIIGEHSDPLLKLARILALTHHEHWDGSGYPEGLVGERRQLRGDDHDAVPPRRAAGGARRRGDREGRREEIRADAGRGLQEGAAGDEEGARHLRRPARRPDQPRFLARARRPDDEGLQSCAGESA